MNINPPDQRILNKEHLDKADHKECLNNLEQLNKLQLSFSQQKKFWIEVSILDRLNYKNRNQHRHFHRFKRTSEVRRLLQRFKRADISKHLTEFYRLFWHNNEIKKCKGDFATIPTKEYCEYILERLIITSIIMDKLLVVLVEAYREYMTFLQLEHFVSMVIVHMGIFARLYSITHKWINELKECYHLVYLWYQITPNGTKSIESTKPYTLTTFDNEREIANQWNENRISYKNPIHFESYLVNSSTITNLNESFKSTPNENTPNDNKSKNSNNTYLFDINMDDSNDYSCGDDDVDLGEIISRS
ncbi:hypothetical protein BJ944DRAFT_246045 [Cunninghamella echinulata]|nr:hypothetical protein BJ944DRAFT_246045 [Cunninghamella echinulata]